MTQAPTTDGLADGRPGGRRSRQAGKRPRRVEFTLTNEEFSELDAAAARAGMARGAYAHVSRTAADAAGQIRQLAASGDRDGAADAAWAAADTLHAAAAALGSRVVREAATAYDRAARLPYGRLPRRTPAGTSLRRASRLLSAAGYAGHDRTLAHAALVTGLAGLAEAVSDLRMTQEHRAQAAAARSAAMYLRGRGGSGAESAVWMPGQSGRASTLAQEAFPRTPQAAPPPSARPAVRVGGRRVGCHGRRHGGPAAPVIRSGSGYGVQKKEDGHGTGSLHRPAGRSAQSRVPACRPASVPGCRDGPGRHPAPRPGAGPQSRPR